MKLSGRQAAALLALGSLGAPAGCTVLAATMTAAGSPIPVSSARDTGDALAVKGLAVKRRGRYELTGAGRTAAAGLRGEP